MQIKGYFLFLLLLAGFDGVAQANKTDSLLAELTHAKEDTNKVILYRMLAGIVKNTSPLKAVEYGKAGVELGKKLHWDRGIAGCMLNISASYSAAFKLDSALLYIDSAIGYSYKAGDPNRLALAYLNRADMNMQMQNFARSLIDCDSSLRYAEIADNDDRRARVYQTFGSIYFFQQKYLQSAAYYDKALAMYDRLGNKQMAALVLNNQGNVFKHTGDNKKAVAAFLKAIEIGKDINDRNNLSMYHENLSDVYLESNNLSEAEKHAGLSMQYARQQQNDMQIANAYECMGRLYLKQKKYTEAIKAGQAAYNIAQQQDFINVRHEASDLLAQAYYKTGNSDKAFYYLTINKELNDSMLRNQFDEDIASMQTKFKINEKDNAILLLETEKQLQQRKLEQQRYLFITLISIGLLALLGTGLLINRYRLQQRMKEMILRNRIAADLHDEVGSSLSSIHMLSQLASKRTQGDATHMNILERMSSNAKETMEKMGDIVWMIKPGESDAANLKQRMEQFAYEICNAQNIEAIVDLEEVEKWKISMEHRKNIYLIFKEALNNAAKYSGTERIVVKAGTQPRQISLLIKDFGKGFEEANAVAGNGLQNMKMRAMDVKGRLEIITGDGKGTSIHLFVPV